MNSHKVGQAVELSVPEDGPSRKTTSTDSLCQTRRARSSAISLQIHRRLNFSRFAGQTPHPSSKSARLSYVLLLYELIIQVSSRLNLGLDDCSMASHNGDLKVPSAKDVFDLE
jgi:hypothetical protein